MRFEATYCGTIVLTPEDLSDGLSRSEVIEKAVDQVMAELIKLEFVEPMISGSHESGEVEVTVLFDADSPSEALSGIDSGVRSAFHAAEIGTSQWQHMVSMGGVIFHQLTSADMPDKSDNDNLIGA